MKKQVNSLRHSARKIIFAFGFYSAVVFSLLPSSLQAQHRNNPLKGGSVNYVGSWENQPVFKAEFDNTSADYYTLTIKDDEGNILYTERFNDKKFSRKFRFDKADRDNVQLRFIFSGAKQRQSQAFDINTNIQVMQDVVVTKL
jgi:hypothetical protein